MKSPAPQEKSKHCSRWWQLIMEEDDEMFPCNIDPFSEDIQASQKRPPKPPPEERMKSPALQENSKQSSQWQRLIMEEEDEMFPCNIDPFSEELVYRFEVQDENKAAEGQNKKQAKEESDYSSQENCL